MKPLALILIAVSLVVTSACSGVQRTPPIQVWPDMRMQPKFEAQQTTGLFVDGRASRHRPEGVVARGHLLEDLPENTGLDANGQYVGKNPIPVTAALLAEGEWRFNTYCAPCHDRTGLGRGMVAQRWTAWQPANLTEQRLVEAADGDLFNTITLGRRTMPPYGAQNRPHERWAIVAYLRVLQRAQHGTMNDVPESARTGIDYKPGPPPIEVPSLDGPTPEKGGAKQ
jgi:mono/diheme cytochrome c family protein